MKVVSFVALLALIAIARAEWVPAMENANLFEGDIVLDPDEKPKDQHSFASLRGGRWPNAVVPYDPSGRGSWWGVKKAMAAYHKHTCIRFVKRTNEKAYIRFYGGNGCSSPLGYRPGRVNSISLGFGCGATGIIGTGIVIHEIGHSLGLHHEQTRSDRDKYVKIHFENIVKGRAYNFHKCPSSRCDSLGTPYDYDSIMHYGSRSFGKGIIFKERTIETLDKSKQGVIGQRSGLSKIDIQQLNLMYCKGKQ